MVAVPDHRLKKLGLKVEGVPCIVNFGAFVDLDVVLVFRGLDVVEVDISMRSLVKTHDEAVFRKWYI